MKLTDSWVRLLGRGLLSLGLASMLALPAVTPAAAAGLSVTTPDDELNADGDCSLREAVRAANTNTAVDACAAGATGLDTITLPAGEFSLTLAGADEEAAATGDLDLLGEVQLVGAGVKATVINGQRLDRVLDVLPGATVTLSALTVRNGQAPDGGGVRNAGTLTLRGARVDNSYAWQVCPTAGCANPVGGHGGGIYNTGTMSLLGVSLVENNDAIGCCTGATPTPIQGGGVYNSGTLIVNDSMLNENDVSDRSGGTQTQGGGLYNSGTAQFSKSIIRGSHAFGCCGAGVYNAGTLKMTNTTFTSNETIGGDGGGLYNTATAILNNVTLAYNRADYWQRCQPACVGGAVANLGSGELYLTNTLIADNVGAGPDCAGTVISQGYNLIENTNRCTITGDVTGNIYGQDPMLARAQLAGNTWTHYPRTGSPAIDAGNPAQPGSGGNACPLLDQRGITRPLDGDFNGTRVCDIGAVEHHQTS